jgi:serine/threonine protein kinase
MNASRPPPATATSALPIGTPLAEFELTAVIGEGGFGIVYSAHDTSLDRQVAIKEYLPSSLALRGPSGHVQVKSQEHQATFVAGLASFMNEARLLASFSHPGLVEVFRFWEQNGTAYMVMRFYQGKTWRAAMQDNAHVANEAWLRETLDPVLLALRELHRQACYHRDIAPDNILVQSDGRSVLMDFGAARRIIGGMTQAVTTVLKPGYAPIEQYANDGSMPQGAWTDIYAVGGLLYQSMTGRVPVQSISRIISDPLTPVSELAPGYSPQLCQVVTHCMAVQPTDRFQSIDALRNALGWSTAAAVAFDPLATVVSAPRRKSSAPGLEALVSKPADLPVTQAPVRPAQPAASDSPTLASRPRVGLWAGTAAIVLLGVGLAAYFLSGSKPDVTRAANVAVAPVPATAEPVLAAPVSEPPAVVVAASATSAPPADNPAPVSPSPATQPSPVVPTIAPSPQTATSEAETTGVVRFELKNGWATVLIGGVEKGTSPPLVRVKLLPGEHEIELRNPAMPTVKRTVTVIAGKTVVIRHAYNQPTTRTSPY